MVKMIKLDGEESETDEQIETGRTDSGWDDQDRDDLPRWVGGNFEKLRLGQLTQVGPFRRLDGLPRASTMYGKIGCYRATYLPMYLSSRM